MADDLMSLFQDQVPDRGSSDPWGQLGYKLFREPKLRAQQDKAWDSAAQQIYKATTPGESDDGSVAPHPLGDADAFNALSREDRINKVKGFIEGSVVRGQMQKLKMQDLQQQAMKAALADAVAAQSANKSFDAVTKGAGAPPQPVIPGLTDGPLSGAPPTGTPDGRIDPAKIIAGAINNPDALNVDPRGIRGALMKQLIAAGINKPAFQPSAQMLSIPDGEGGQIQIPGVQESAGIFKGYPQLSPNAKKPVVDTHRGMENGILYAPTPDGWRKQVGTGRKPAGAVAGKAAPLTTGEKLKAMAGVPADGRSLGAKLLTAKPEDTDGILADELDKTQGGIDRYTKDFEGARKIFMDEFSRSEAKQVAGENGQPRGGNRAGGAPSSGGARMREPNISPQVFQASARRQAAAQPDITQDDYGKLKPGDTFWWKGQKHTKK